MMKTTLKLCTLFLACLSFVACSNDDGDDTPNFTVASFSPAAATPGSEITITGTDFPSEASEIAITIGGASATIVSVTATTLVAEVPEGATSGAISITVNGVAKTATTDFTLLSDLVRATASDIHAPQTGGQGEPVGGPFTKFSFETGGVTDSETAWDIAFRGTTIAVNGGSLTGTSEEPARNGEGGAAIVDVLFAEVTSAASLTFAQDAEGAFAIPTGSDNGWYNYNFMTNLVTPIPGKILVFKTHDGKMAKVEILSYYEGAPANPNGFTDASRYYTFNYVYNPNEGENALE